MPGFEAYRNRKKAVGPKCPRCHREGPGDGIVVLEMRERNPGRKVKTIATHSKAMCEECCVRTFEELMVTYESKMKKPEDHYGLGTREKPTVAGVPNP